jgi:hypothetical protein
VQRSYWAPNPFRPPEPVVWPALKASVLVEIHEALHILRMDEDEAKFLALFEIKCQDAEFDTFRYTIVPYLVQWALSLKSRNAAAQFPRYQTPFGTAFGCLLNAAKANELIMISELPHLHSRLLDLDLTGEARSLMERRRRISASAEMRSFDDVLFPYLSQLLPVLREKGSMLATPEYMTTYRSIAGNYLTRHAPMEPKHPTIQLQLRGCGCTHCNTIDRFLLDSSQRTFHFQEKAKERKHVESRFQSEKGLILETGKFRHSQALTLALTKLGDISSYQEWQGKTERMRNQIRSLAKPEEFRRHCGEDVKAFMPRLLQPKLISARIPGSYQIMGAPQANALWIAPHAALQSGQTAGQKRSFLDDQENRPAKKGRVAEVIDLVESP